MREDEITVEELRLWRQENRPHFLLDVREPYENAAARIEGGLLIPMRQVPANLASIPKDQTVVVYCHAGTRSASIVGMLRAQGYDARNMVGGILAWARMEGQK